MSSDGPGHTPSILPKPQLPDLAAARELGPAETVEARWQQLLLVWQWHHERHEVLKPGSAYPDIVSLIEATGAGTETAAALSLHQPFQPELQQLHELPVVGPGTVGRSSA